MIFTGFWPQSITYLVNGATLATEGMAEGTLTDQSASTGISVAKTSLAPVH
jgi:hypothetical protein